MPFLFWKFDIHTVQYTIYNDQGSNIRKVSFKWICFGQKIKSEYVVFQGKSEHVLIGQKIKSEYFFFFKEKVNMF